MMRSWRKALQTLDEMIGRRDAVAAAKGDVEKLYDALQELEATFTRLTGLDAVRNQSHLCCPNAGL